MSPAQWAVTLPSGLQPHARMSITHLGECWRSLAQLLPSCKEPMMAAGGGEADASAALAARTAGTLNLARTYLPRTCLQSSAALQRSAPLLTALHPNIV